jgi:phosphoribosylglycinamide formyltransferase-1
MQDGLPFALYCSGNAVSLQEIYQHPNNDFLPKPQLIIYDGESAETLANLNLLFENNVVPFYVNDYPTTEQKKPHYLTSLFIKQQMEAAKINHLLCFGKRILKPVLLQSFPNGVVNFHPSLLPAFKGVKAIDQALATRSNFLGLTAHFIDEGIDTGQIILQAAMYRKDFETYKDVLELTGPILKTVLRDWLQHPISEAHIISDLEHRQKAYFLPQQCHL